MRILLTGGSGDLGTVLIPDLITAGYHPINLDVQAPRIEGGEFIQGSITDRNILAQAMQDIDMVVHIAAWHGIHDVKGDIDTNTFWDVNVTGTFNVFESAVQAGVKSIIYISSTSVDRPYDIYGHTKIMGEKIAETYHNRHNIPVISLRPRAFIPHWNRYAYSNFVEWAKWFWKGAVHLDDVKQGTFLAIEALANEKLTGYHVFNLDGAYDYTAEDLAQWDEDGEGSTFRKYYAEYEALAKQHGLDITLKPRTVLIDDTRQQLGYEPQYSLKNLLEELEKYGIEGSLPSF